MRPIMDMTPAPAVKLHGPGLLGYGKAFPYFYDFLRSPYSLNAPQQDQGSPGILAPTSSYAGDAPDGISVPSGITKDINLRLDPDFAFHLLDVKYTARLAPDERYPATQVREVMLGNSPQQGFIQYYSHPFKLPQPVYEYLRVSLYARSGTDRVLYGDLSKTSSLGNQTAQYTPVPMTSMQGFECGKGSVRTEYICAAQSIITVRVTNLHPSLAIVVDGYLFGYKVAA